MSRLSLAVSDDFANELEQLAKATRKKKSELLLAWVRDGLALEKWQLQRVEAGIKAADNNAFANDNEFVQALEICRT